jgi:diaminopimelate epimerase
VKLALYHVQKLAAARGPWSYQSKSATRRAMMRAFTKMHGLGNDFVLFDARIVPLEMDAPLARAIADRMTGIGCDQVIVLGPSTQADVQMRIFNADGGEVEACGNATRCVPLFIGHDVRIETLAGVLTAHLEDAGVSVDMGQPRFDWDAIPLAYAMDTLNLPVHWEPLPAPACVNVGNPHIVFFVDDLEKLSLDQLGPLIETDPLFPRRINVNFAQQTGSSEMRLIVWERGVGFTRACGTGACATAVAAIRRRLVAGPVQIDLPGGSLTIDWSQGQSIIMTGPAVRVFDGQIDIAALAA